MAGVLAYAPAVDEEPKAMIVRGPPRAIIPAQFDTGYCKAVNLSGTAQPECETAVIGTSSCLEISRLTKEKVSLLQAIKPGCRDRNRYFDLQLARSMLLEWRGACP